MRALAVIPARLASTRLPRKVLLRDTGKFLIEHVVERVRGARRIDRIVVATDSDEVVAACASFGVEALMTSASHTSGTDRVAEATRALEQRGERFELVVNVQGDEPELRPSNVDALVDLMDATGQRMGTLVEPLDDPIEAALPQVVKVVLGPRGQCIYFSRAIIPSDLGAAMPEGGQAESRWLRHVGIYAYRPDFLEEITKLPPVAIEKRERLEQLRALAHGYTIVAAVVEPAGVRGIDTPEDYAAFVRRMQM